jgi:hypothetical protein
MTISYRTNKHYKNRSVEEHLERYLDALDGILEFIEIDPVNNSVYIIDGSTADAKNLDDLYKRVCNCIQTLEYFRAWLNRPSR